ncbi:MAG: hypothetical protein OHK0039_43690 [Bacteroidia bacterium]
MERLLLPLMLLAILYLPAQPIRPLMAGTDFSIDGDDQGWRNKATTTSEGKWKHFLTYDETYLYIGLLVPDVQTQQQIWLCGMTVWIYPGGKKKLRRGVRFPLGVPPAYRPDDTNELEFYRLDFHPDPAVAQKNGIELLNFYGQNDTTWGQPQDLGLLDLALGLPATGLVCYELALPLSAIPGLTATEGQRPDRFSLVVETGVLGRPTDLMGDDGVGVGDPASTVGVEYRDRQARFDRYRLFTISNGFRVNGLRIE